MCGPVSFPFDANLTDAEAEDAIVEESIEIYNVLSEFDVLEEIRMTTALSPEEQRAYNELHESLTIKEREFWWDIDSDVIDIVEEYKVTDFPMLRLMARQLCGFSSTEQD